MRYILQARDIAQVNKTFKKENRTRVEAPERITRSAGEGAHRAHRAARAAPAPLRNNKKCVSPRVSYFSRATL